MSEGGPSLIFWVSGEAGESGHPAISTVNRIAPRAYRSKRIVQLLVVQSLNCLCCSDSFCIAARYSSIRHIVDNHASCPNCSNRELKSKRIRTHCKIKHSCKRCSTKHSNYACAATHDARRSSARPRRAADEPRQTAPTAAGCRRRRARRQAAAGRVTAATRLRGVAVASHGTHPRRCGHRR